MTEVGPVAAVVQEEPLPTTAERLLCQLKAYDVEYLKRRHAQLRSYVHHLEELSTQEKFVQARTFRGKYVAEDVQFISELWEPDWIRKRLNRCKSTLELIEKELND